MVALKIALAAVAVLLVFTLVVRLIQSSLTFFPTPGETETPTDFGVDYRSVLVSTADGERLQGWELTHHAPTAHVLYLHGNGGNLSMWTSVFVDIARRGYAVFAFDYRGYGVSTGRPSEQGLYRDVTAVVDRFWAARPDDAPVVYWGRSLGTVMAAYASTLRAPDGLILESGFPDVRSLLRGSPLGLLTRFSSYRLPAAEFLQDVSAPVLVLHGDEDRVVPMAQGRLLFDSIAGRKQFVSIRGGNHGDVTPSDPDVYWDAVERFITGLPRHSS